MPRQRKPTHLRLVEGDKSRRGLKAQRNEPVPEGDLWDPPAHLNEDQAAAWRSVISRAPVGLLKRLDSEMLEGWVVAYCLRKSAVEKFEAGGKQMLIKTPNGAVQQSPYIGIINRQSVIMKALAAEMGFSPAARTRVSVEEGGEGDATDRFFRDRA